MGATLEFSRVKADSWKEARDKAIEYADMYHGQDPYNGSFNTIYDWNYCRKDFDSVDDFEDWVCDNGDKREAYVWEHKGEYIICGWCAC